MIHATIPQSPNVDTLCHTRYRCGRIGLHVSAQYLSIGVWRELSLLHTTGTAQIVHAAICINNRRNTPPCAHCASWAVCHHARHGSSPSSPCAASTPYLHLLPQMCLLVLAVASQTRRPMLPGISPCTWGTADCFRNQYPNTQKITPIVTLSQERRIHPMP